MRSRMMGQMRRNMHRNMRVALRLVQAGALHAATQALQRNLRGHWTSTDDVMEPDAARPSTEPIDGEYRVVADWQEAPEHAGDDADGASTATSTGEFRDAHFSCDSGELHYKLFVPAGFPATPRPLLIMLHGCTQTPDDFARGTRMNVLAQQHGYVVAYPAQAQVRNSGKCWNWFRREDQERGRGEPALIAALARHLVQAMELDGRRVFAAGLSAGGAMAVVLARAYPDVFAAIGVHSGLPFGIAHDIPSAFAAMKPRGATASPAPRAEIAEPVPTIVFHGDRDTTVALRNGTDIVAQCLDGGGQRPAAPNATHDRTIEHGTVPGGRQFTRTTFRNGDGSVAVEEWIVHGAGHAWCGGDARGTYTDPLGPDASEEMLRFFAACTHPAIN